MGLKDLLFGSYSKKELKKIEPIAKQVMDLEEKYKAFSDDDLRTETQALKERLQNGETTWDILPEAFAVCREAADRVLNMRHFYVQIIGGIVLHQGRIAEMRTGEGKTLVATLPAFLNALTGEGVHVVTVNDYLARRDSEWMGKIFRFLGLSVGLIVQGLDNDERRAAYACDITYGTNNEFGFDYLRDNMVIYKERRVQRGHAFAIVDEVDSILIDEARTPLIISGQGSKSTSLYKEVDRFVRNLKYTKVAEQDLKQSEDDIEGDYIVDEKGKTATLTRKGAEKAEQYFNIENLNDPENMELLHHITQAIKARGVMKRDIDYVVKDGQVMIVDEFTGRIMIGRRFNEGLHQALEAKENVEVLRESKTLATITFQNYFRMYKKLSGMTGTAMTEEDEFATIYSLDIVEVPTNRPNVRIDHDDVIYKNEKAKFNAVIERIVECHQKGQPVLVGTISIEKSELLGKMLSRRGVKHEVLNAKFHDKEAEIIAQAGKLGAVTIATNMAGRGTDIILGGNAEYMAKNEMRRMGYYENLLAEVTGFNETKDKELIEARETFKTLEAKYKNLIKDEAEKVKAVGGLYIIGTERHESRRIDNQLRGRAARQGDPGETIFFLSLEDDLMRLFGGERIQNLMETMNVDENTPIEMKMLTNSIEQAQKRVEGRNFGIRKNVLRYDDVMNKQREIIYGQRSQVLDGHDISATIASMLVDTIKGTVGVYVNAAADPAEWNLKGLRNHYLGWITEESDLRYSEEELANLTKEDVENFLVQKAQALYAAREEKYGDVVMREMERVALLRVVDTKWMAHIDDMDQLKRGIGLRSYAQKDPVVEYQIEGFDMFDEMIEAIKEDTLRLMLTFVLQGDEPKRTEVAKATGTSHGDGSVKKQPKKVQKVGRNDPCPCGSGKKYKKCCGRNE